jgi:hypothetical protein
MVRGLMFITIKLFLTIILPNVSCSTTVPATKIPLITAQIVGPPDINLPGITTDIKISSQNGTTYNKDGVTIVVPAFAVSEDRSIILKEFTEHPPEHVYTKSDTSLPAATSISKIYDLGPNGAKFDKPVTVSIPYYKQLLHQDYDKSGIVMAYFDGRNWVSVGGQVDTDKGTITASFTSFPGIAVTAIVAVAAAVTSVGIAVYQGYEYADQKFDGTAQNKAKEYVMPNSPIVKEYVHKAGITIPGTKGIKAQFIPFEDPNNLGQINPAFLETMLNWNSKYDLLRIGFNIDAPNPFTTMKFPVSQNKDNNGKDSNWTPPDKFIQGGMTGDCTCVANLYLSILRNMGVPAYGVVGYKKVDEGGAPRHAWVEVVLNGEVYYYDDVEGLVPLKNMESRLDRLSLVSAGDGQMWDEKGQKNYDKDWWKAFVKTVPTASLPTDVLEKLQKTTTFKCQLLNLPTTIEGSGSLKNRGSASGFTKHFYVPGNAIALGGEGTMNIKWSGTSFSGGGMNGYPDKLLGSVSYKNGKVLVSFNYATNNPGDNLKLNVTNLPCDPKYFMDPKVYPDGKPILSYMSSDAATVRKFVTKLEWNSHEEKPGFDASTPIVGDASLISATWTAQCGFDLSFK